MDVGKLPDTGGGEKWREEMWKWQEEGKGAGREERGRDRR